MEEETYQKLFKIIERVSQEKDTSNDGILNIPFYYFEFNSTLTNKEQIKVDRKINSTTRLDQKIKQKILCVTNNEAFSMCQLWH